MNIRNHLNLLLLSTLLCIIGTSCFHHSCVGRWKGEHQRGDLTDIYDYDIHPDGTVDMTYIIPQTDYELHYTGRWKEMNSDVIYMDLMSDVHTSRVTYSQKEQDEAIAKEKSRLGKEMAYNRTNKLRSRTSRNSMSVYLRKDGHTANWDKDFESPDHVVLTKD